MNVELGKDSQAYVIFYSPDTIDINSLISTGNSKVKNN
jgi:hypothetical protein